MYWIRHYELETNYHCIKTGFDTTLSTPMFMIYSEYICARVAAFVCKLIRLHHSSQRVCSWVVKTDKILRDMFCRRLKSFFLNRILIQPATQCDVFVSSWASNSCWLWNKPFKSRRKLVKYIQLTHGKV